VIGRFLVGEAADRRILFRSGAIIVSEDVKRRPILQLIGASKRFGAVEALRSVDFEVFAGEVVALVGDNGAGKSTLVKILSGTYRADAGKYVFEGVEVKITNPRHATELGIQTVYQDLALCENLDVVSNLYLGREQRRGLLPQPIDVLDEIKMERAAVEFINELHVNIPSLRSRMAGLSGGQRQSVAVARAVMWNSKVVILDEPTAALGIEQTQQVKQLILRLSRRGLGVVVVSHNLADIFDVSDRIVVLRLGARVATFDTSAVTPEVVVGSITGVSFGRPAGSERPVTRTA
jgi:D-xylose transport system ATP-binding protein